MKNLRNDNILLPRTLYLTHWCCKCRKRVVGVASVQNKIEIKYYIKKIQTILTEIIK